MRFIKHPILWILSLSFLIYPLDDLRISANEAPAAAAVETSASTDPIKISVYHEDTSVQPGHSFFVAVQMEIQDGWYAYWKNPGLVGMAPDVTWNLPDGFEAGELIWPTPKRLASEQGEKFGYENKLTLLAEIKAPKSYAQNEASITANVRWLVCSDSSCLPGETPVTINLSVAGSKPQKAAEFKDLFNTARANVPKKMEGVTATRSNGLIEIGFDDPREVNKVEFFSEHKKAIDAQKPDLVQQSQPSSNHHALIVKELSAQPSIKGILVVHTPAGSEAFEIETPIVPPETNDLLVGMAPPKLGTEDISHTPSATHSSFEFQGGLALAILLAFLGGMILNLMPCVLPVISLKILGFVKLSGQSRKLIFQHGAAFSLGVLLSFWVLAAFLLVLQAYGRSVGWGFQLQEPFFVAILVALLFMFGLSLFGVFEVGTSIVSAAGEVQQRGKKNQLLSSFFSGVLATALATPCTGPFLGSAVGYAFTLPAFQAMLIFTSLGIGMSSPYIALSAFPALLRFLPKPGPWMVVFKELMGFLMMASVIWLLWVFSAQTNSLSTSLLLVGLFLFAIACWIYGKWATPMRKKLTRTIGTLAAIAFVSMGSYVLTVSAAPWAETTNNPSSQNETSEIADGWEEFSVERIEELRKQGIPVFVDFTAKWCLICQTNHIVLTGDEVENKFKELGVVKMKADWTKKDEVIAAELRKFGRNSVPLYVFYGSDAKSEPQILPQVLTSDTILGTLEGL